MAESAQDVVTDDLFVGLTRPAMVWGIPYSAFVLEVVATTLVFLAVGHPLWLLLIVPVHGLLYAISAHDPGVFAGIYVWLRTIGRCRNSGFWQAASFSPLDARKWREP